MIYTPEQIHQFRWHMIHETILYLFFLAGQMLFFLKRSGSAVRNGASMIKTRREYFYRNWDTVLIRAAIELCVVFYPLRHYSLQEIAALVGYTVAVAIPNSPVVWLLLGYASDSLLDWVSMSQKLPGFVKAWIHENVPPLQAAVNQEVSKP